jgi:hypothetical protein
MTCTTCGHGVVQCFSNDLQTLYGDGYSSSDPASGLGYSDYQYTAEHGVAWAAALIRLLRPSGRILDIGCADGRVLRKFSNGYERFGIEPNVGATEQCRAVRQVEQARDWHADQATKRDHIIAAVEENRAQAESCAREAESHAQEAHRRAQEAERRVQEAERRVQEAENGAQQLTHQMFALQQSWSWKVTRPFRLIGSFFVRR